MTCQSRMRSSTNESLKQQVPHVSCSAVPRIGCGDICRPGLTKVRPVFTLQSRVLHGDTIHQPGQVAQQSQRRGLFIHIKLLGEV